MSEEMIADVIQDCDEWCGGRADAIELAQAILSAYNPNERLREALEPFVADYLKAGVPASVADDARWADVDFDNTDLLVADFRRAVSALSPLPQLDKTLCSHAGSCEQNLVDHDGSFCVNADILRAQPLTPLGE